MSNSLRPHGLQHARLPCPSLSAGVCSNSCSLSQWCHPTISSSVILVSSRLQSFPASGSFPRSQFFTSGGQSIGASASASVLPVKIREWFLLGWTGWISWQSKTLQSLLHQGGTEAGWSGRRGSGGGVVGGLRSVSSLAQSCPTLPPHGRLLTRPPCPSPSPGACSNSCPSSRWFHSTISSSVIPFCSCLQSFSASGSFPGVETNT